MREIVMNTGRTAKVDDEDYEWLSHFHWTETHGYASCYYAPNKRSVLMHRLVMNAEPGQIIDHIDRDKANNQRSNLRFCTHRENMRNRSKNKLQSKAGRWLRNQKQVAR